MGNKRHSVVYRQQCYYQLSKSWETSFALCNENCRSRQQMHRRYELAKIHHIRVTVQYASRQRLVVVIKKQYTRMSNVRLDLIGKTSTKN
eukprot:scaffold1281_cov214-Chaetoceros_neogracile.AAC.6